MDLLFMKQSALEHLKGNLKEIYTNYFTESTNDWLTEICGEEPFVKFKEIPNFELAPLDKDLARGEIDFQNCKTVYSNLKFLSDAQASDERFWAGLAHGNFYEYLRTRWNYFDVTTADKNTPMQIKGRFFFDGRIRKELISNTLAKYWWTGKLFYDSSRQNPFEKLSILGPNDLSSNIRFVLSSYQFSCNPTILNGILKLFLHFKGKYTSSREFRSTLLAALKRLNTVGGSVILDCLSEDEIAEILIKEAEKNSAR